MRDLLAAFLFIFLGLWFGFVAFMVIEVGVEEWTALGLGAVTGVLLKMLSDMWQFYFRKKGTTK